MNLRNHVDLLAVAVGGSILGYGLSESLLLTSTVGVTLSGLAATNLRFDIRGNIGAAYVDGKLSAEQENRP